MRTAKACAYTGCLEYSRTESAYCPTHTTIVERPRNQRRSRKRRQAPGDNAARRHRTLIRNNWDYGIPTICAHCREPYAPPNIEIDHIITLIDGGTDTDNNIQTLCRTCHQAKTTTEHHQRNNNT